MGLGSLLHLVNPKSCWLPSTSQYCHVYNHISLLCSLSCYSYSPSLIWSPKLCDQWHMYLNNTPFYIWQWIKPMLEYRSSINIVSTFPGLPIEASVSSMFIWHSTRSTMLSHYVTPWYYGPNLSGTWHCVRVQLPTQCLLISHAMNKAAMTALNHGMLINTHICIPTPCYCWLVVSNQQIWRDWT